MSFALLSMIRFLLKADETLCQAHDFAGRFFHLLQQFELHDVRLLARINRSRRN